MATSKKLTAEELAKMEKHPVGYKHAVRAQIESLNVGEGLLVSRQDFNWKGKTPNVFCIDIAKKTDKRFKVYNNPEGGWIVERLPADKAGVK